MNRFLFASALALLAGGCSKPAPATFPPPAPAPPLPAAPAVPPGYVRHDDASLAPQEAKVIAVAKAHLEKTNGKPVDAYYKVTKTPSGFSVDVEDVNAPPGGGHCTVLISSGLTVVRVLPGA